MITGCIIKINGGETCNMIQVLAFSGIKYNLNTSQLHAGHTLKFPRGMSSGGQWPSSDTCEFLKSCLFSICFPSFTKTKKTKTKKNKPPHLNLWRKKSTPNHQTTTYRGGRPSTYNLSTWLALASPLPLGQWLTGTREPGFPALTVTGPVSLDRPPKD